MFLYTSLSDLSANTVVIKLFFLCFILFVFIFFFQEKCFGDKEARAFVKTE